MASEAFGVERVLAAPNSRRNFAIGKRLLNTADPEAQIVPDVGSATLLDASFTPSAALDSSLSTTDRSALCARAEPDKRALRMQLYTALVAFDLMSIVAGFIGGNLVRFGEVFAPPGLTYIVAFTPIFLALAVNGNAYSIGVLYAPSTGILRALRALGLTACVLLMLLFYTKTSGEMSRAVFGAGVLLSAVAIGGSRWALGKWARNRARGEFVKEILLVDGVAVPSPRDQQIVHVQEHGISPTANDPSTFERIGRLVGKCDRVILACASNRREAWRRTLLGAGIDVEVLTPELDQLGALQLRQSSSGCSVLISHGPLRLRDRFQKRIIDLAICVIAVLVLAPLMVFIAVAIKATSRGPVLFRQQRIGQANKTFYLLKFRTMRFECCDALGTTSTAVNDHRVTTLGHFLRRTSLDELPQLFNVLIGDMSIVGPRPHALASTAEDMLFWNIDERYWRRAAVKPGITGLAQIQGFRGATHKREDLVNRIQADIEYLNSWSIWRDMKIMLRTARVIVHERAY